MKKFAIWMLASVSVGLMSGCDDDDNGSVNVPSAVRSAFEQMYPGASGVEWKGRNDYVVADFRDGGSDMQAWFDAAGNWFMTEVDIPYSALPAAVKATFEASDYASWTVDDVDKLLREGMETLYVIEVERGDSEVDLCYSEDGVLLRAVADTDRNDDNDDLLPQEVPQAVKDFIGQKYPGARIVDAERERGELEVEIVDGRTLRDVYFGTDNAWLRTKTEVRPAEVSAAVLATLEASQYGTWEIDDIDHFVNPDREWYVFELEEPRTDRETEVSILADGTLL